MSSINSIVGNNGITYEVSYNKENNSTEFCPTEGGIIYTAKSGSAEFSTKAQFRLSLAEGILGLSANLIEGFDKLISNESNIELNGLPDNVHNQLSDSRTNIISSGVFGNIVTSVLNTACKIGENIPIIKDVIGPISSMISPEVVGNTINKTLVSIEENFFQNIEEDDNYSNLKNSFFDALSLENIVNTTQKIISYSSLFAAGLLTDETLTIDEVLGEVKGLIESESGTTLTQGIGTAVSLFGGIANGITSLISGLLSKD